MPAAEPAVGAVAQPGGLVGGERVLPVAEEVKCGPSDSSAHRAGRALQRRCGRWSDQYIRRRRRAPHQGRGGESRGDGWELSFRRRSESGAQRAEAADQFGHRLTSSRLPLDRSIAAQPTVSAHCGRAQGPGRALGHRFLQARNCPPCCSASGRAKRSRPEKCRLFTAVARG